MPRSSRFSRVMSDRARGLVCLGLLSLPLAALPEEYVVRPGDTLHDIGTRHGVSYVDIGYHNHLVDSVDLIHVGQVIDIPEEAVQVPERDRYFYTSHHAVHTRAGLYDRFADHITSKGGSPRSSPPMIPLIPQVLQKTPSFSVAAPKLCTDTFLAGADSGAFTLSLDPRRDRFRIEGPGGPYEAFAVQGGLIITNGLTETTLDVDMAINVAATPPYQKKNPDALWVLIPSVPAAWQLVFQQNRRRALHSQVYHRAHEVGLCR